jgi:hypothetical protein
MFTRMMTALIVVLAGASAVQAGVITLVDTIPSGNLWLQPPVLTTSAFANAFTPSISAMLYQVSVVVEYEDIPQFGLTGRSPMLLTLLGDSGNSPGAPIESWTVSLSPSDTSLTIVTVNSITQSLLLAGQQYWLSEVPTDPGTGIGWGLASPGYPGIQLPIAVWSGSGWGATTLNLANEFSVSGTTVPEPGTFGISALALLSIIAGLRAQWRN